MEAASSGGAQGLVSLDGEATASMGICSMRQVCGMHGLNAPAHREEEGPDQWAPLVSGSNEARVTVWLRLFSNRVRSSQLAWVRLKSGVAGAFSWFDRVKSTRCGSSQTNSIEFD